MSKAKITYDENGATFFYFVLSFLALILVPSTYYLWPSEIQEVGCSSSRCGCNGCVNKKQHLGNLYKWKRSRHRVIRTVLIIGWLAFIILGYKCATTQHEYVNWDPFEVLGISEDASANDIKKAYRKLSLIYHPDKETGDEDRFVKITKAYAALTDEEAKKNWELYGNPDGPGAKSFGIALPSWIVEKENSGIVLGIYALVFMVALPVSVGTWWYRSMKFGCDKVLINTTELYYYYIYKTPTMPVKRVIMILAASLEFAKTHNPEVVERPTDNQEVPRLIRDLPMLGEKNQERPLCFSFSIKSRAIIHAHLSRIKLPPKTLDLDRCFIVRKCPYLLQEFVSCIAQLTQLALSGRVQHIPNLVTLENAMKLCPSIVQAIWEYQSPLLQLPHFSEETLKLLEKKKIKIKSIDQLAKMNDTDRRNSLKIFTDAQYADINYVLSNMPRVHVDSKYEVFDDEAPNVITSGAIVTIYLKLRRYTLNDFSEKEDDFNDENEAPIENKDLKQENKIIGKIAENDIRKVRINNEAQNSSSESGDEGKDGFTEGNDDEEWNRQFQEKVVRRQKVFESKLKKSHSVHCPYFPDDKQEFWWVYVVDRKRFALVTVPILVTSLVEIEELELKFTAPHRPGSYSYTIVVRSDSYVDAIVQKTTKVEVKPAKEYVEPVFDIEEDEDENGIEEDDSAVEDSDLLTDNES